MTRLILWRHGQTDWNANGRVQGSLDIDLNATGEAQTAAAALAVAAREPTHIIASDLRRAARAAEALSAATGLAVEYDPRLRERSYGPWEGLLDRDIQERDPENYARWHTSDDVQVPGIEPNLDLGKRLCAVMLEAAEHHAGGTIVLATHGAAARAGCATLLGWPVDIWSTLKVLHNCWITELQLRPDRGWQLYAHNVP